MRTTIFHASPTAWRRGFVGLAAGLVGAAALLAAGCGDSGSGGTGGAGGSSTSSGQTSTGTKMSTTSTMSTTSSMSTTTTSTTMSSSSSGMGVCGDGNVDTGEDCDDGGTATGDGCDASCALEPGYVCMGQPSVCATDCGDGIVAGTEACDDGNSVAGDGCDMTCVVEHGFMCVAGNPSMCLSTCGDGLVAADEQCDDGGMVDGDGCDSTCAIEPGWTCANEPTACMPTNCGDGIPVGMEACDDGNQTDGDGCSAGCQVEMGFMCSGAPSMCTGTCGDGLKVAGEECDDSNLTNGDCCDSNCKIEPGCEIELNNTQATANNFGQIAIANVIHGFVSPVGDADFFAVTIPAGPNADITAITGPGVLGTVCATGALAGIDSRIRILDSMGMQLGSNDDNGTNYCSALTVANLPPGTYYVEVDASPSAGTNTTWDYNVTVTLTPIVCGNGVLQSGEQCDDGNLMSGDGCSSTCQVECPGVPESEPNGTSATADGPINSGFGNCAQITPIGDQDYWSFVVTAYSDVSVRTYDASGVTCNAATDTLVRLYAPDGTTQLASNDDGPAGVTPCSQISSAATPAAQHLAPGTYFVEVQHWNNTATIAGYQVRLTFDAVCGNGIKEGSEECDGGATCDATCQRIPVCGDGFIDAPETCDDANTMSGDGCSSTCQVENVTNEVEPNGTEADADANVVQIAGTSLIAGSIGVVGDLDIFRVTVGTPTVVRFETFDNAAANDCNATPTRLQLFNSAFASMAIDTTSGISTCSELVEFLPAGTYYIQVSRAAAGTIASYRLEVRYETDNGSETEPNDTQALASTNIQGAVNVYTFGGHQVNADLDYYAITVPAGGSVRAEVIEGSGAETCESNGIDSLLRLYNSGGTQLVSDDDSGRGFCSAIDGTGTTPANAGAHNLAAGTYYLGVSSFSAASASGQFDYRLVVVVRNP